MGRIQSDESVVEGILRDRDEDRGHGTKHIHLQSGVCMGRDEMDTADIHLHGWSKGIKRLVSEQCAGYITVKHDLLRCLHL